VLLLGFIGIAHWLAGQSVAAALSGVLFFGCLFACVLLHEYGHAHFSKKPKLLLQCSLCRTT
jgi:hypothetical protein